MQTLTVQPQVISPVPRELWETVLAADPAALPEYCPQWVDAMVDTGKYQDASRCYRFADGSDYVLPLVRRRGMAGVGGWLQSYPAAWGIGGLIGPPPTAQVIEAVLADLHSLRQQRVGIRPDPMNYAPWAQALETAGGSMSGLCLISRRAHVVDLSSGLEQLREKFAKSARHGIRAAQRQGVQVTVGYAGELLEEYYELYLSSLKRWAHQQHEPVGLAVLRGKRRDPLDKLRLLARHLDKNFAVLLATIDGHPVCGSIVLLGNTAHETRCAMDRDALGTSRAGELLRYTTLELACARGCTTLHMGESGASQRLAQFKEKFGASAHDYAEVRLERLPWTRVDVALRTLAKRILRFRDA